jgi:N-acetylglucosamine-6-phosphate deacetylase
VTTAFTASVVLTPQEILRNGVVVVHEGKIERVGGQESVTLPPGTRLQDFGDAVIAPGLIDVHIHGGGGHDVMEGSESALKAVESLMARHGVTSYCPTTVTAPVDATLRALEALGKASGRQPVPGRATPLGLHLEGPFISTAKCGVHPVKDITAPSLDLLDKFWQAAQGRIRMMTVAPERPGAIEFIAELTRRGVRVSLGHSDATTEPAREAVLAGAAHATHTFNAMRALDHRDPGILGVVLSESKLSADIIADGVHVAPEILRLFVSAKGEDKSVLITDAISATGMPEGTYRLGTFDVEVKGNTCMYNGRLAGSVLTMDRAVRNMMEIAEQPLQNAVRMATLNPARLLGIEGQKGSLAAGADADLVVLTKTGQVLKTVVAGVVAEK